MKGKDEICPICGAVNKSVYLEETNGWFECEKCKGKVLADEYFKKGFCSIPLLKLKVVDVPKRY